VEHGDGSVLGIVDEPPHPTRRIVEAWLAKMDKWSTWIAYATLAFAAIGAAASLISCLRQH
jgi:hypothetical protein